MYDPKDPLAKTKEAFNTAQRCAHDAASAVAIARSWLGYDDRYEREDDRDPAEMMASNLARAVDNARAALAAINHLQELTKAKKQEPA